jgi:hypothetical protein
MTLPSSPFSFVGVSCGKCHAFLVPPGHGDFTKYFFGGDWVCPKCGAHQRLWNKLLEAMLEENELVPGTIALGLAASTIATFAMVLGQGIEVSLDEIGVPEDAIPLNVFLTPSSNDDQSPVFPALMLQRLQREVPRHFVLRPIEFPGDPPDAGGVVNLMVTWLAPTGEPEIEPLVAAADAFDLKNYRGVIVPANIAVEAKLNNVMAAHYAQFSSKSKVKEFLGVGGASYGHQVQSLWPSLFSFTSAPPFPTALFQNLNQLRSLRNKVAHEHQDITRIDAATMLLTALFGYRYLAVFGHLLAPEPEQ